MSVPADPRIAVGKAVRTLTVRRLARAFVPLALLAVAGAVAGLMGSVTWGVAGAVLLGAPAAAGALLILGQTAVRRAFGLPSRGLWRGAGLARIVPFAWGSWVLVVPAVGAGRAALDVGSWGALGLASATGVLGARVLLDALAVAQLGRLADTMTAPAPGEGVAADGEGA